MDDRFPFGIRNGDYLISPPQDQGYQAVVEQLKPTAVGIGKVEIGQVVHGHDHPPAAQQGQHRRGVSGTE